MILEVFDGRNASVIALGARGSGKTYTIQVSCFLWNPFICIYLLKQNPHLCLLMYDLSQGSQEKPGVAVIAMSEILSKAKELGKSVSMSLYELARENVKDLLNPDHPTIQVLEDAQGKINIKGLSKARKYD